MVEMQESFKEAFKKRQEDTIYIRYTEALARIDALLTENEELRIANSLLGDQIQELKYVLEDVDCTDGRE